MLVGFCGGCLLGMGLFEFPLDGFCFMAGSLPRFDLGGVWCLVLLCYIVLGLLGLGGLSVLGLLGVDGGCGL